MTCVTFEAEIRALTNLDMKNAALGFLAGDRSHLHQQEVVKLGNLPKVLGAELFPVTTLHTQTCLGMPLLELL